MTRRIAAVLLAGLPWMAGCQLSGLGGLSGSSPRPAKQVDEVFVRLSPPTAMNWDDRPGPDGLQTRVNFFRHDEDLSVAVDGTLEFELYEGRASAQAAADREPFHVWRFENGELERHLGKTIIGWGYEMRLPWDNPPKTSSVTLVARHRSSGGHSEPSVLGTDDNISMERQVRTTGKAIAVHLADHRLP